ncbi:hypothetical protein [Hyphomicrobium sp.]|jgi:hypothetical protein|uniref:hypothetical protein n=1 Tax=Hyphomicrobium sp. TaxID=82 RepID=UPI0035649B09
MLVRNRLFQRWFLVLGMVAMLGALLSMPMASTYAFAMSAQSTSMAADSHDTSMASMSKDMDCAKPANHCPNCPQKFCPEMGSCLVKCFQPLSPPAAEARLQGVVPRERVMPTPSRVTASSLIPPLLRPPSV